MPLERFSNIYENVSVQGTLRHLVVPQEGPSPPTPVTLPGHGGGRGQAGPLIILGLKHRTPITVRTRDARSCWNI